MANKGHQPQGYQMSNVTTTTSPLTTARKAKKYGHVSLAYALAAIDPKSTLTGSDIAALEATGTAKQVAPVLKALASLPTKPGRFWDILEGRIAPPVPAVAVFAPKGKATAAPAAPAAPAAKAAVSDLV